MPSLTDLDRRAILRLIAGGAATMLASCGRPDEPIHPLANQPEGALPRNDPPATPPRCRSLAMGAE